MGSRTESWLAPGRAASLLLAAALGCALLLAAACGDDGDTSPNGNGQPDPAALLQSAADRLQALNSFHFVFDHENGASPIVEGLKMQRAEGDVVKPDRLQADIDAVVPQLGNARVAVSVVAVGSQAKITNPFNRRQWIDLPGENPLAELFDPRGGTSAVLQAVRDPRIVGEETIGGVAVWRVEGDVDGGQLRNFTSVAEAGHTVKGTAWIGKDDPLVYRIRLEGPVGPRDDQGIVRRIELSRFDQAVTIELPG
jgi:hypothetical protein